MVPGSIPSFFGTCTALTSLVLGDNALTGTIPSSLGRLAILTKLDASVNKLSGSVPAEIASGCRALSVLSLENNTLTGHLPDFCGAAGRELQVVSLYSNALRGTIPSSLGNCSKLETLYLMFNMLMGSVSDSLGQLIRLTSLRLEGNILTGHIPGSLAECTGLFELTLHRNLLSGSVPSAILTLPRLSKLLLSQNRLTGTLNMSSAHLQFATLFGNMFRGTLLLPISGSLWFLVAHSNRFSCDVSGRVMPHPTFPASLAAPGNQLQAQPALFPLEIRHGPSWETAYNAAFLWVGSALQEWGQEVIVCMVGAVLMLLCVATTGVVLVAAAPGEYISMPFAATAARKRGLDAARTRLWRFVQFEPKRRIAHAQLWCARRLALLALVTCSAFIPTFTFGAKLYQCGDAVTKYGTIAYISDSLSCEWCAAAAACGFLMLAVWLVLRFQQMLQVQYAGCLEEPPPAASRAAAAGMYLRWVVLMVLCTIIAVAYAFSVSVPPNTTFGNVPFWVLTAIGESSSLVLALTTAVVIPACCRRMSHRVFGAGGHPSLTSRLMQIARLWTAILAPALALVFSLEDCFGGWKLGWKPCDEGAFEIPDEDLPVFLVKNVDVCSMHYTAGRCSRAVVQQLSRLLLSKLAYASFLLPAAVLLLHTPFWRRVKETVVRRFNPVYMAAFDVDAEFTGVLMYMEFGLVFGVAIPVILPAIVVVICIQCAVFHHAEEYFLLRVVHDHRPSLYYLWVSVVLGWGFAGWIFFDNDLHGKWLVLSCPPFACIFLHYCLTRTGVAGKGLEDVRHVVQ